MRAIIILFVIFFVLLALNVPIAFSLGICSAVYILMTGCFQFSYIANQMFSACDSFTLTAIPLFVLAGALMQSGGLSKRLIDFCDAIVGHIQGGLAVVTILACMLFGAISGSAAATVATIGVIMVPSMLERGYSKKFSYGLVAAAGVLGVLIPPSIPMVLYGSVTNTSIATMFMGGIGVGVVCGIVLIIFALVISRRNGYKGNGLKFSIKRLGKTFVKAIAAIIDIVIILGGIYSGIFTPTEAGAVAVVYSFIVGFFIYKELSLKKLWEGLSSSAVTTCSIMLIMGTATIFARILTIEQIPTMLANLISNATSSKIVVLILINVFLLLVGCVMDGTPAVMILAPILMPIATAFGVDPIHFGLIMVLNISIGFITPPVGLNLYVACNIGDIKFTELIRGLMPFFLAMLGSLVIVTYVPGVSLLIPRLLGYGG